MTYTISFKDFKRGVPCIVKSEGCRGHGDQSVHEARSFVVIRQLATANLENDCT